MKSMSIVTVKQCFVIQNDVVKLTDNVNTESTAMALMIVIHKYYKGLKGLIMITKDSKGFAISVISNQ